MKQEGKRLRKADRQPKATDKIKAYLEAYTSLRNRIDMIEKRKALLELSMGAPSTPNLSGLPGGSCDRSSKQERDYIKKEELEEKLGVLSAEENRLRDEIEAMIERMEKPVEQSVIEMHYLDGMRWKSVSFAIFGEEPDYDAEVQRYLKRTHRIHGTALLTLARLYKGTQPESVAQHGGE